MVKGKIPKYMKRTPTEPYTVRLTPRIIAEIETIAATRGISPRTLARVWLGERVEHEISLSNMTPVGIPGTGDRA